MRARESGRSAWGCLPQTVSDRECRAISSVADPGRSLAAAGPSGACGWVAVFWGDGAALGGACLATLGEHVVGSETEFGDKLAGLLDGVSEFSLARFSDLRFEGGALGEEVLVAEGLRHGVPVEDCSGVRK